MNFIVLYQLLTRSVGQAAKTLPSHGRNRGSIPLRTIFIKTDICRFFYLIKSPFLDVPDFAGYYKAAYETRAKVYHALGDHEKAKKDEERAEALSDTEN